jgi:hypothetical protein
LARGCADILIGLPPVQAQAQEVVTRATLNASP